MVSQLNNMKLIEEGYDIYRGRLTNPSLKRINWYEDNVIKYVNTEDDFIFKIKQGDEHLVQILKDVIARPRPFVVDPSITPLVAESPTSSMPSGHASSAFAFAIVIAYYFPKSKPYMITFAIIMAVSRLYAFVHFPTDVILGSIIGILSAYITIYFVDKYLCKKIFK